MAREHATLIVEPGWRRSREVYPLYGETSIGGPADDIPIVNYGPVAVIAWREGAWRIRPTSPRVTIDGAPLVQETALAHGQRISIERLHLRFVLGDRDRVLDEERHAQTVVDPMTQVFNRRFVASYLARMRPPTALVMADVDMMKMLCDRYGHMAGDDVLIETARRLMAQLSWPQCLVRFGGEEFIAVLPNTSLEAALAIAERMRVACLPEILYEGESLRASVSLGVAMLTDDPIASVQAVDDALVRAKVAGRNRVAT
jgi:diguanylate cyclase (GGDEF)-like protein